MSERVANGETPQVDGRVKVGVALTLIVTAIAVALILIESPIINGSEFWRWMYQAAPVNVGWTLPVVLVVTVLCATARAIHAKENRRHLLYSFALLAIAAIMLRLATTWLFSHEISLAYIDYVVRNPTVGSYFTVAERIMGHDHILIDYPRGMEFMPLHAMNKPPGFPLFNLAFIKIFGNEPSETAALVGVASMLLSLVCIPLSYAFVRNLGGTATAGFQAATLWVLAPGAAIFSPLFDPLLTVPVLMMAIAWTRAIREDRYRWSATMGFVLAVTLFCTFNILPIGLFLAALGFAVAPRPIISKLRRLAFHAAAVLAVAALLHAAFALATGFNLIATLRAALANQAMLLEEISRPYPKTIWWDLIDYTLGVAWVPIILTTVHFTRQRRPLQLIDFAVLAGVLQLIVTAISALLPGETARVWNFMFPLILLPAALELDRWPRWAATIVYAAMALLTALLARSMIFMEAM